MLDEEYLRSGLILSEWCSFIVRSANEAFAAGAFWASILTAVAGFETYLRSEGEQSSHQTLAQLIDESGLDQPHVADLHALRRYRNRWTHVNDPWDDAALLSALPIGKCHVGAGRRRMLVRACRPGSHSWQRT